MQESKKLRLLNEYSALDQIVFAYLMSFHSWSQFIGLVFLDEYNLVDLGGFSATLPYSSTFSLQGKSATFEKVQQNHEKVIHQEIVLLE